MGKIFRQQARLSDFMPLPDKAERAFQIAPPGCRHDESQKIPACLQLNLQPR
jgi:hypothetical protein